MKFPPHTSTVWFIAAIVVALVALPLPGQAQFTHNIGPYDVTQWTTREGLPTDVTSGLARDRAGFLWVSTYSGLARFDGVRFERFDAGTTSALPSSITYVNSDKDGELLIRSGKSLVRSQDGAFFELENWSNRVRSVHRGAAGSLIAQLSDSTIVIYDGGNKPIRHYRNSLTCGQGRDGKIWLVHEASIRCLDGDQEVVRHSFSEPILSHYKTPWGNNGLLLHLKDKIGFVSPDSVKIIELENAVAPDLLRLQNGSDWKLYRMVEDTNGAYWLATATGLFRCETFPFSPSSPPKAGAERILPFEMTGQVYDIYEDDRGAIWVASSKGGLFRIRRSLAQLLPTDSLGKDIRSRSMWAHHTPWLTTWADKRSIWLSNLEENAYARIDSSDIASAIEDSSEGFWVSWVTHATKYQHGKAVQRLPVPVPISKGIPLTEDDGGGLIWEQHGTIQRFHNGVVTNISQHGREVLRRTPDGAVWFVTTAGLHRYQNGIVHHFTEITSRDLYFYRDVWTSPTGDIWVATRGKGLAVLSDGQCRFAGIKEGVPDNIVGGIVPDDEGRLWINSNRGVFVVAEDALNAFARNESDWLSCRLVTRIESSTKTVTRGNDGRLYFDTMDGITAIDPSRLPTALEPAPAQIVELHAGGQSIRRENTVRLPKDIRSLMVRYTAPDLHDGSEVRFRHRLGQDAPWTDAARQREILLSNLSAGTHRFEVQAASAFGPWSGSSDAVQITIAPYYYETGWFKFSLWAVVLGSLSLWHRMRLRARDRRFAAVQAEVVRRRSAERSLHLMGQRLISAQEQERRRIARELHDDVSQRLALLSVKLDMIAPKTMQTIPELAVYCRKISSDIRSMSHTLHPAKLEQLGLSGALESLCRETGGSTSMELSFNADGSTESVPPEAALCLYRIAQEALRNSARHSGGDWASVEILTTPLQTRLIVADGGKGFDQSKQVDVGLGLTSMAERVTGLAGSLEIESHPGEGTVVRATLPLTQSQ